MLKVELSITSAFDMAGAGGCHSAVVPHSASSAVAAAAPARPACPFLLDWPTAFTNVASSSRDSSGWRPAGAAAGLLQKALRRASRTKDIPPCLHVAARHAGIHVRKGKTGIVFDDGLRAPALPGRGSGCIWAAIRAAIPAGSLLALPLRLLPAARGRSRRRCPGPHPRPGLVQGRRWGSPPSSAKECVGRAPIPGRPGSTGGSAAGCSLWARVGGLSGPAPVGTGLQTARLADKGRGSVSGGGHVVRGSRWADGIRTLRRNARHRYPSPCETFEVGFGSPLTLNIGAASGGTTRVYPRLILALYCRGWRPTTTAGKPPCSADGRCRLRSRAGHQDPALLRVMHC